LKCYTEIVIARITSRKNAKEKAMNSSEKWVNGRKGNLFELVLVIMLVTVFTNVHEAVAVATDRYVETSGFDEENNCLNSAYPCLTVEHAISMSASGDTIHIGPGSFTEHLLINKSLTLAGAGMEATKLDGDSANRVVDCSNPTTILAISDLTIQEGKTSEDGGGIRGYCGSITGTRIKITGNHAKNGGGFAGYSRLFLTDSVVSGNYADQGGSNSWGGGLYLDGSQETILTRVTISGNTALGYHGAIHSQNGGVGSTVNLMNVTISENTGDGWGIVGNSSGTMTIENSTIADNIVTGSVTGAITSYSTMIVKNSIIANNGSINCYKAGGNWTSLGNNIDSGTTCNFTAIGDKQNTDPVLGSLQNNGGYTPTMALEPDSPAIDNGSATGFPATDQRGVVRPQGVASDIGAYEFEVSPASYALKSPGNYATKRPSALTLKWNASYGATEYQYCLKKSGGNCSWKTAGTATSVAITGLLPGTEYFWEVRAKNGAGTTYANGGAWWNFTTLPKPGIFNKTNPATGSTNKPTTLTLYWGTSSNAASYEYCIKKSLSTSCTWKTTGLIKKVTLTSLSKNTKYYWQVRAKNAMGTTLANGGVYWNFKTKP
jgi:hypothetical protein